MLLFVREKIGKQNNGGVFMATAVKACKKCNTEMSKSLRRCPSCGCRHITAQDWTIGIILAAIIVVIIYALLK